MTYDKASYQKELDESLAKVGVTPAIDRLEKDEYPYNSGESVEEMWEESETEEIGGFTFIEN